MTPSLMQAFPRTPLIVERGEGAYLWDVQGRRYLDFVAGVAVNALGHCHPALVAALTHQAGRIWHASNVFRIPGQESLADRLVAASFADAIFFNNSGSEAVDFAIKLVRKHAKTTGAPHRWRVVTMEGAFHGRTMAAIAAGGQPKLQAGFEPLVEGFDCVPFGDLRAVSGAIGPETAAIMVETIQGDGGIRACSVPYLQGLRELADAHGLLLVLDEVQSGMGRTGKLFAHEWAGIAPDILATAKGLGAGYPLGAVFSTARVADCIVPGSHGSTLGGSPLGMAVGHAVLDILLAPSFFEHVVAIGTRFRDRLERLVGAHPHVFAEVRGAGLMLGLRCVPDNRQVMAMLREHGLLVASAGDNVIRLLPPLNIGDAEVDEAMVALETVACALWAAQAGAPINLPAPASV